MARLSRNDPAVREVRCRRTVIFGVFNNAKAAPLGLALTRNSVVSAIDVPLQDLQDDHQLDDFLSFIADSSNLEEVTLYVQ